MRVAPPLVALTPGDLEADGIPRLVARVRAAVEAGLPGLLLREPRLQDGALLAALRALREAAPDAWIAVHDRVHLAAPGGADAAHLGFRSLPPREARRVVGELALGLSTHASDEPGDWELADYLFHGPLHATPKAHGPVEPIGLTGLAAALAATSRPVLAIGGITPANARACLDAGAAGVAVLRGVLGDEQPGRATRAYLDALGVEARPA